MADFMGDYTTSTELRNGNGNGRYLRTDLSNTNTNGHPSVTGALDPKVLCLFQSPPAQQTCQTPKTSRDAYRAVRQKHLVGGQIHNSFRSVERGKAQQVKRTRNMQLARCTRLLEADRG